MNVYKVSFDIKVAGEWLGEGNPNGWSSRYVLAEEARQAGDKLEVAEKKNSNGGKVQNVSVISIQLVASDVLK